MSRYPFFGNPAVYVDPSIISFTAAPALAEMGSTVPVVTLNWRLAKTPDLLTLDGVALPLNTLQTAITGVFTTDTTWKLTNGDTQRKNQAKAVLSFCNNVFWGFVSAAPADSAGVNALDTKTLQIKRGSTLTVAERIGKTFCYAYPARLGAAKVTLDVPSDVWQPTTTYAKFTNYAVSTVSVTNDSGFTEDYTVLTFLTDLAGSTVIHIS